MLSFISGSLNIDALVRLVRLGTKPEHQYLRIWGAGWAALLARQAELDTEYLLAGQHEIQHNVNR